MLDIVLPGTGGTMPMKNRWLASLWLRFNGRCILVDCGEGTQIALRSSECSLKPINTLLFTHFHADHVSGLPGLLLSMGNDGRTEPLLIAGPPGTERIVRNMRVIAQDLPFDVQVTELSGNRMQIQDAEVEISAFPLKHSTVCYGYRFHIPRLGKFDREKAKRSGIPICIWSKLQKEGDTEYEGILYRRDQVMGPERKGISLCYVVDSRPTKTIVQAAEHSDLLICEGMFGEPDKLERARTTGHMLFSQAAQLAKKAEADRLILTHYSPSLHNPEEYLPLAREIFEHTDCGYDGMRLQLHFPENFE